MREKHIQINSPDNKWHAEISACRGANIVSLQYLGQDVFNPLKNEKQWGQNPFIQGSPLLFPANRTAGAKFAFEGMDYTLPVTDKANNINLHGLLYRQTFSVAEAAPDMAVLRYENTGDIFPFRFIITAVYTLKNCGLKQEFTLRNLENRTMPYTFALHTAFADPERFSVPISLAQEKDSRHIPTGRYIPLNETELKYVSGLDPRGIAVSGYYKANGNTATVARYRYTVSDAFDHFVLYNGGGNSGYLCVEPQAGAVNGLNIPGGCRVIPPGECDRLFVNISV